MFCFKSRNNTNKLKFKFIGIITLIIFYVISMESIYAISNEKLHQNTLTNLNGGVPVETENVGMQNFVYSRLSPAQQNIQEGIQAEDNLETMKLRRYAREKEQAFEATKETGVISTNYLEELKYNEKAREKKVRELVYDIARIGNTKQEDKLQEKEKMMQELEYLKQNTNCSVMQEFMISCAAISGTIGIWGIIFIILVLACIGIFLKKFRH